MSNVFSGGLVYEYTSEGTGYGLVEIKNGGAEKLPDFDELKQAFSDQKDPSGDGGYKKSGSASQCPAASDVWEVKSNALPSIPEPAKKYLTGGAGKGAGLSGSGSQNAGTPSETTAAPGSGSVSSTPGANGAGVFSVSMTSVVCAFGVSAFGLLGAGLW